MTANQAKTALVDAIAAYVTASQRPEWLMGFRVGRYGAIVQPTQAQKDAEADLFKKEVAAYGPVSDARAQMLTALRRYTKALRTESAQQPGAVDPVKRIAHARPRAKKSTSRRTR